MDDNVGALSIVPGRIGIVLLPCQIYLSLSTLISLPYNNWNSQIIFQKDQSSQKMDIEQTIKKII